MTRDHGGNIDQARAKFGGDNWIDLSTGINRVPYPIPDIAPHRWADLPTASANTTLIDAAKTAYRTTADILPLSGASAAIQLIPRMTKPGIARVLGPTYNEHAAALKAQGWQVQTVSDIDALEGADLAVIVNPNNPTGQTHKPADVLKLKRNLPWLIVDESFADMTPELSLTPSAAQQGLIILRSFGKFYGLAGLRLGFALGHSHDIDHMRQMAGPWAVSGPALAIGANALTDNDWALETTQRLQFDAARMDAIAARAGWHLVGGTTLFRTYETPHAPTAQNELATHRIWSRIFPYSAQWLRLGLPGPEAEWDRVEHALSR